MKGQAVTTEEAVSLQEDREMLGQELQKLMFKVLRHRAIRSDVEAAASNKEREPIVVVYTHTNKDEKIRKSRHNDQTFDALAKQIDQLCKNHPCYPALMYRLIEIRTRHPGLAMGFYIGSQQRLVSSEDNFTAFDTRLMASMAERVAKTIKRT